MPISAQSITQIAQNFLEADQNHTPIKPVASFYPNLTPAEAYQVGQVVVSNFINNGHTIVGKKAAATSTAAQAKMNLTEPIYGHLLDFHRANPGDTLSTTHFFQPFIECEFAFIMGQTVTGPNLTAEDILAATAAIVAAFDIIDFRTTEFQVGMAEALCSNVYARHFVLSQQHFAPAELDLPNIGIGLSKNGELVATATGAAIMGHPARSIAWVANKLAEHGQSLAAGQFVLTGAITKPYPILAGDRFVAEYDLLGTLAVGFA